jgi:hypothetical protein
MPFLYRFFYMYLFCILAGCGLLKENGTYELDNGRYKQSAAGKTQKVWVSFEDSVVRLYPLNNNNEVKKSRPQTFSFNEVSEPGFTSLKLQKSSFDIDVITIPFKYRPSVKGFPNQLNTNFSGAVYAGLRNDFYHFNYRTNAIGENRRRINHFGISFGVFSGIGSSAINPWVTQRQVTSEYDGFLLMNGLAGLVAVNKLTFGLGLGIDHLLDKNKKYWIYRQKPWLGLTVGLNLN